MNRGMLRWAGGKSWLTPTLVRSLPNFKRYIEPFCGAANLFFAIEPKHAILADLNPMLISTYSTLTKHSESIINSLLHIPVNADVYYQVRKELYNTQSSKERAAYFLYLNQHCWNGLFRVNKQGRFNVPYGRPNRKSTRPQVDVQAIRRSASLLAGKQLMTCDFESTAALASAGDLIYFDPPYKIGQNTNAFSQYTSLGFSNQDEERLAAVALMLANRGVHVIVSHALSDPLLKLYSSRFLRTPVSRAQTISGKPDGRRIAEEIILSTFPIRSQRQLEGQLLADPIRLNRSIVIDSSQDGRDSLEIATS